MHFPMEAISEVKEARKQFESENGREPDYEEMAEAAGISITRITAILHTLKSPISLYQKIGFNPYLMLVGILTDPEAKSLDDMLFKQSIIEDLEKLLNKLNPRRKQVVRWRYGLEDGRKRTLQEIGQVMGVTGERIRQIELSALTKLNKELDQSMLNDLEKLSNTLNPREKQVVIWRYVLEDGRKRTLQEIGQVMGVPERGSDRENHLRSAS